MSREELYFSVYATPRPQGSKRYIGNGRFVEASDVKPWRAAIARAVAEAFEETGDSRQFLNPVEVEATFYLLKPKTVKRPYPSVPPDLDKLLRGLGDGLSVNQPKALADDSLIVKWTAVKLYTTDPEAVGVRVSIRTIDVI